MARDDEWEYSDAGDEEEWEYSEAPGALHTFGRSFRQGINPLWDEGAGFMGANVDAGRHLLETGSVITPTEWLEGYRRNRDESRDTDARGAQANPTTATAGRVTGAVVQGIASGGAGGIGRGLVGAVTSGATQGAVNALAGSEADLTRLKGEEYARAATDTLGGGAAGAVGGGVGYGVGKGLAYVGGKARDAYRGARGALEGEVRAGLDAEEAALRARDAKEAAPIEAAQGRANKVFDAKATREEARRVASEARAAAREQRSNPSPAAPRASPVQGEATPLAQSPGRRRFLGDPNEDPSTRVLEGYRRGAMRRVVDNEPKVLLKRELLQRPGLTPEQRVEAESYLDWHGDAVDNPLAFRRKIIEDDLLRRGYSPEVVRRGLARIDADGRVVSRGAQPPDQPLLPERTQTAEPSDWLKRGHDMEELAQQGGGGSAMDGLQEAPTRVDARMQPDPFHDAPTRPGLVQVGAHAPDRDGDAVRRVFSFADKGSGKEYQITAYESPHDPRVIVIGGVGERGKDYMESWGENANSMGPKAMRELLREIARAFPGAERVGGFRVTGISPNRGMNVRLPEVTQPGTPDFPEAPPLRDWQPPSDPTLQYGREVDLPPMAAPPGEPSGVQRFDVLGNLPQVKPGAGRHWGEQRRVSALPPEDVAAAEEAMAARRAAAFGSNPSGPAPEPTAGARPRAMPPEASASMRAPMDGPEPSAVTDTGMDPRFEATFAEGTRATRVPEVRRAPMRPEATTVQPGPEATQVGGPSDFTDATRYAPPDMAQRLAGRSSVDSLVDERIAGGGQALRGAFMRGATGESGAMAGVAGHAHGGPAGGLKALALRGGLEVVREALRNPAAKARAIEAFKLQRLAAIRPEVWGRVSATLQRAAQRDEESGTDYHARAARHALLQTDPAFRAAEAEAAKELQGLSEDELARRLAR